MERDLNQAEFQRFHDLIYRLAGIHYPVEKLALLSNRIRRRLRANRIATYDAYLAVLQAGQPAEVQGFLDSVTTRASRQAGSCTARLRSPFNTNEAPSKTSSS